MRVVERLGDVGGEAHGFVDRELLLPLEALPQRFAFHIGHHVVDQAAGLAGIEQRQDMRVLQVGGDPDLTQEAIDPEHGGELGAQHLHGDVTVVLEIPGAVHGRHAAGAELAIDGVVLREGRLETLPHVGHGVPRYRAGKRAPVEPPFFARNTQPGERRAVTSSVIKPRCAGLIFSRATGTANHSARSTSGNS